MDLARVNNLASQLRVAGVLPGDEEAIPPFSVGIGLTDTEGEYLLAIRLDSEADRVYLDTPTVRTVLSLADDEIDVQVLGALRTQPAVAPPRVAPTLKIGSSVSHHAGRGGTLGFFAERNSDGKRGFVSCNHVIAARDFGKDGDAVVHPAVRKKAGTPVALLDGSYPKLKGGGLKYGDCAFAAFIGTPLHDPSSIIGGALSATPATVAKYRVVTKVGAATDARPGTVTAVGLNPWPPKNKVLYFRDVIEVESASYFTFSEPGDSGSLVYTTDTLQPVGLLFRDSDGGGPFNSGKAWLNAIDAVTSVLKVRLVVA